MERRNINRGFLKLSVWQDAVSLYVYVCELTKQFPFEAKKSASNAMDASLSIQRSISEGYCTRSLNDYLNFLIYSLGSCGETYASIHSFKEAKQITEAEFEEFDKLHFKTENQLNKLIQTLHKK